MKRVSKWQYNQLMRKLSSDGRKPSPKEWDIIIDYNYPEDTREHIYPKYTIVTETVRDGVIHNIMKDEQTANEWIKKHPFRDLVEPNYTKITKKVLL